MREIKFRGKRRVDNGEWIYGYYLEYEDSHQIYDPIDESYVFVIPETVGQFINHHDKNGKEIYVGDIILLHSYPYSKIKIPREVKWEKDNCGFYPFNMTSEEYGNPLSGEWCEVIGNVYENPELKN